MHGALVQALILLAVPSAAGAESDWLSATRLSVALVDATLQEGDRKVEEPATGFIVGWSDPILYVVTAGHVLEDRATGLAATEVNVRLAPEICPGVLKADPKPAYLNREHDFAALAVALPSSCASNLARLRRLRVSFLAKTTAASVLQPERVSVVGRSAEGQIAPIRDIPVRGATPERDILLDTSKIARQLSGAPVLSSTGELVGIIIAGSPTEGIAASYEVVRGELGGAKVPRDFAGEVASLRLTGAPVGSTVRVDQGAPEPLRDLMDVAPGKERTITVANGDDYEPATVKLDLLTDTTVRRCVTLTTPGDQRFARWRWPLLLSSAAIGVAGVVTGLIAWQTHRDFDSMPTRDRYDSARLQNTTADVLMGVGLVGVTAFGVGHAVWTPRARSAIDECQSR